MTKRMQAHSLAVAMAMIAGSALAADCDFNAPTGTCVGSIRILKASGSKPSYAAELNVSSSAPRCSKVEFFVNSTPYQTVLRNKRSDHESVFGTSPITRNDIEVSKCTTYASATQTGGPSQGPAKGASAFAGTWNGSVTWMFVSSAAQLTISSSGSSARGNWHDGKSGNDTPFTGAINGNTMTFNYVAKGDGSHGTAVMTLTGAGSANITFSGRGITFSGNLTKS